MKCTLLRHFVLSKHSVINWPCGAAIAWEGLFITLGVFVLGLRIKHDKLTYMWNYYRSTKEEMADVFNDGVFQYLMRYDHAKTFCEAMNQQTGTNTLVSGSVCDHNYLTMEEPMIVKFTHQCSKCGKTKAN